ncbi:MAG: GNAT family N-acetyltransferase [Chloroflexota bacterium]
MTSPRDFHIQIAHRVDEIGQPAWDALSAARPFASYDWHRFGETVMADSPPTYLILSVDEKPAARATLYRVPDEPLPLPPLVRGPIRSLLRRRPPLICRSPLANWNGLLLPENASLRGAARTALLDAAKEQLAEQNGSLLLFDFLDENQRADWPADFILTEVSDAGTRLEIKWKSLDEYLASTDKRGRQHYKRVQREAEKLGLELSHQSSVADVEEALALIRRVERKFRAAPNPWMRGLLENAPMIRGVWQEVRQRGRLVGCGLLLEDNGVMLATALGLAEGVSYAYFLLIYACLQEAVARRVKTLRLGSGAYDVKRRLGFVLEDNNHTAVRARTPFLHRLVKLAA